MAEIQKAVAERDLHAAALTGNQVAPVTTTYYDGKRIQLDNADDYTTAKTIKGVREWIERHYGVYPGYYSFVGAVRPWIMHGSGTFGKFLTSVLGYSAWKRSTAQLLTGRLSVSCRDIEELRKCLESMLWAPLWFHDATGTYYAGETPYGTRYLQGYNRNGDPTFGWGTSKSAAWTMLKGRIAFEDVAPVDRSSLSSNHCYHTRVRWDNYQYLQYQNTFWGTPSWNQRGLLELPLTHTREIKYSAIQRSRAWKNDSSIAWDAFLELRTSNPGGGWYSAGGWTNLKQRSQTALASADTWEYWDDSYQVVAAADTAWLRLRGWESNLTWTDWNYANAVAAGVGHKDYKYFLNHLSAVWEKGAYVYGNPDA